MQQKYNVLQLNKTVDYNPYQYTAQTITITTDIKSYNGAAKVV